MSNKVYLGDIGTILRLDTNVDLTDVLVTKIKAMKPDGTTVVEYDAEVHGTTEVQYIFALGDIDQTGVWLVQAYIEINDWKGLGETAEFTVYPAYE